MEIYNHTYTLKNCRFVVDYQKIQENVNIVIDNGKIKDIGNDVEGDEVDCSNYIVTPGFVNAHTHSGMIFLRGYYDDAELMTWLDKMWESERKATKEILRLSSEIAVLEMLSSGTTAFVDMYFNPEDIKELTEKYGIIGAAGYTFLNNVFDPEEVSKNQQRLRKTKFFYPIVNVHSLYTVDKKTLEIANELANEQNTWINIHLSETRKEIYEMKLKYGKFPIEYLNELNIKNYQGVHLGWIASWEIEYLKNARAVTHCPTSNMKLATAGAFPFYEIDEKGINLTLGTDGPASNNSLDIIREMKNAVLLQRHSYWDTRIKALHVFKAATYNGYKLFGLNGGIIDKNEMSNLVLFDASELYPLKKDRILSNLVYFATSENVKKIILSNRIIDKQEIKGNIKELAKKLNELLTD
ncbi:amidohydrolase family protein [Acidianus sulfidivorans JP7]|uniref:N-ethylammeline chlorohydrolase n=1 Tax=Acidianus sulfidivorans JP7 TaxID=619593 RepID=A0A2U9IMC7_9CREN|nr:amidohydrolase [Acidianus sulfidivorans]AWR97074.1 amidohydrolase family protein [Acidianus sulfidivorans JP7]